MTGSSAPTDAATQVPRGRRLRERAAWTAAVLGLALVVVAVVGSALGWSMLIFRSGSMSPDIPAGALAVARPVPVEDIAAGDVVSVTAENGDRITHRVVDVAVGDDGVGRLTLRGDANAAPDQELYRADTVDRVVVSAPLLGYPVAFLLSPVGLVVLGCVALGLVVLAFGGDRRGDGGSSSPDAPSGGVPGPRRPKRRGGATAAAAGAALLVVATGSTTGTLATFSDSATLVTGSYGSNAYFTCSAAITGASGGADIYWRFDESSTAAGSTAADSSGKATLRPGQYRGTVTGNQTRACSRDTGSAVTLTQGGFVTSQSAGAAPGTFTASLRFRTSTTTGGRLFGFGNSQAGTSSTYDRHVYMTNGGNLVFGIYAGGYRTVITDKTYRDNIWHQVTVTYSASGLVLYVDGEEEETLPGSYTAETNNGYWRVGNDNLAGWPSRPSNDQFLGTVDDFVLFTTPQSAAAVRTAYRAGLSS